MKMMRTIMMVMMEVMMTRMMDVMMIGMMKMMMNDEDADGGHWNTSPNKRVNNPSMQQLYTKQQLKQPINATHIEQKTYNNAINQCNNYNQQHNKHRRHETNTNNNSNNNK